MMRMGIGPGPDSATLHYLEVETRWKIFITEPPSYEGEGYEGPPGLPTGCVIHSHKPPVRWSISFDGDEIVCGSLQTTDTAKRIALIILEALLQEPPPEEVPQKGGYGIMGGDGQMEH